MRLRGELSSDLPVIGAVVALLIGPMLVVSGCGKPAEAVRSTSPENIHYWADERADVCFARVEDYGRYVVNVPCNERVRQLAREGAKK